MLTKIDMSDYLKEEEYCLENPFDDEKLVEDPDDIYEDVYIDIAEDIEDAIERCKQVTIYTKNRFQIDFQYVKDYLDEGVEYKNMYDLIESYSENWGMDYWDRQPERMDIVQNWIKDCYENGYTDEKTKKMVDDFNKEQYWYTAGDKVGYLDLSQDMAEFLKEAFPELSNEYTKTL